MTREIIYETHSTSEDNEKKIASGHFDPPLSEKGRKQALDLGKRYANRPPQIILCSDLRRSYETAQIAFPGVPRIQSPLLREWNYGIYNGRPVEEVDSLKSSYIWDPFPEGEDLESVVEKALGFIEKQLAKYPDQKIMIIAHRSTFYALEHRYKKRPLESIVDAPWHWKEGWNYNVEK